LHQKDLQHHAEENEIFKSVKDIVNLLAFKILNEQGSLSEIIALRNATRRVQDYLKASLNLFLYCITFGLVFSMGNPLGGDKEWLSLNEDNFEKTLNLLKENEELKLALEEKNENCGPKIMNGLVDYA
ncbi:16743_t:CDS:2, partial [Dentiscutata erythropus]